MMKHFHRKVIVEKRQMKEWGKFKDTLQQIAYRVHLSSLWMPIWRQTTITVASISGLYCQGQAQWLFYLMLFINNQIIIIIIWNMFSGLILHLLSFFIFWFTRIIQNFAGLPCISMVLYCVFQNRNLGTSCLLCLNVSSVLRGILSVWLSVWVPCMPSELLLLF